MAGSAPKQKSEDHKRNLAPPLLELHSESPIRTKADMGNFGSQNSQEADQGMKMAPYDRSNMVMMAPNPGNPTLQMKPMPQKNVHMMAGNPGNPTIRMKPEVEKSDMKGHEEEEMIQTERLGNREMVQSKNLESEESTKRTLSGPLSSQNPSEIQRQLGEGDTLNSRTKTRMEGAFGTSFSDVRIHDDSNAARISRKMNARAFTVGNQVAFNSGEYKPSSMMGEALIAHEMAHVVQQKGGGASVAPLQEGSSNYNAMEKDADRSASNVMVNLWSDTKGMLGDIADNAMPRLRSGLSMQGCTADTITDEQIKAMLNKPELTEEDIEQIVEASDENLSETQVRDIHTRYKTPPPAAAQTSVGEGAISLAGDAPTMESFYNFYRGTWGFFYSKNSALAGSTSRPASFSSMDDYFDSLSGKQRIVLVTLHNTANSSDLIDDRRLSRTNSAAFAKLKAAYDTWPTGRYAIFQQPMAGGTETAFTCNLFVGGSLFRGGHNVLNSQNKFYSAHDVYEGAGGRLVEIDKVHARSGDIAAFGGHVAIVVKVDLLNNALTTRDGTSSLSTMGVERTGTGRDILGTSCKLFRVVR